MGGRRRHTTSMRFLVLLLAALPLAGQGPVTIAAGRSYAAGTLLHAPAAGVTFTIPPGLAGGVDADAGAILLADGAGTLVGVWAVSAGTTDELADHVGGVLASLGLQLAPAGAAQREGEVTLATFHAMSSEGRGQLVAALRQGPTGAALAVAAFGVDPAVLRRHATAIAAGARFTAPGAEAWRQAAAGHRLLAGRSASEFSGGGVGDGTYASQTDTQLELCRDGRYGFRTETESYLSVEGAGGMESRSSDAHHGQWALLGDILGRAWLALEASDGRAFLWTVEETPTGAIVDGARYAMAPGSC